jgi:hypothetical protein
MYFQWQVVILQKKSFECKLIFLGGEKFWRINNKKQQNQKKKIFKAILLNYEIEDSNSGKPYECFKICQLSF